jgi:3-oxoacyl-[acyl-carrier-protein] synthase II
MKKKRIGIYGWGIVAPKSPDIAAFERNLNQAESWLVPFDGYGPNNFLVGEPDFDFGLYKPWFDERFEPRKFAQLDSKMGNMVKFALGAFIQSLGQNRGLEEELQRLGHQAHIYVGTGLGDLPTNFRISRDYERAQRRWNRFWSHPDRNSMLAGFRAADDQEKQQMRNDLEIPEDPAELDPEGDRFGDVADTWCEFWIERSDSLRQYLEELREIEAESVGEDIEATKGHLIRRKASGRRKLNVRYGCPLEPWNAVEANLLWNIPNIAAAQISMSGKITGPTVAPIAACAGFGTTLKFAIDAIRSGQAKAAVVGSADPEPHPLTVGSFFQARVVSQDGQVSKPFTGMRGTHVSGGACIWVVGDVDHFEALGMTPLGMEIIGVAINSDADHIITPTQKGPRAVMLRALEDSGTDPNDVATWDMHATATPGDWTELQNTLSVMPGTTKLTARKGSFGHGMSVCGGWELTAQHLGFSKGFLHPVNIEEEEIHPSIRPMKGSLVGQNPTPPEGKVAGKLNMGVGGVNSCVISRLWEEEDS